MALADAITALVDQAERLAQSSAANEANTKALLIEPLLAALGGRRDLTQVSREYRVYDGTFLDYAL